MASRIQFKRLALRLGAAAVGIGAAAVVGTSAARAASPATEVADAGAAAPATAAAGASATDTADPGAATAKTSKPEHTGAARPARADTGAVAVGAPPSGVPSAAEPATTDAAVQPEPTPAAAPSGEAGAPPAGPPPPAAVEAAPAVAGAPVEADADCAGACGPDIEAQVVERSYDGGADAWTVTAVADVVSELGCYVDPVCVMRIDTSGAPLAGPAPALVCPSGWTASTDGACRRSEGTAVGSGFAATMTTTAAPPPAFEVEFVLAWEHLGDALAVAETKATVSLGTEPTLVVDCPRSVAVGTTFACVLDFQLPPGTPPDPFASFHVHPGPGAIPNVLSTSAPNWSCFVSDCMSTGQAVGAWTTFTSTWMAIAGGLHELEWHVFGDGTGLYRAAVFFTTATDADIPSVIQVPAVLDLGTAATVSATFVNTGGSAAVDPFLAFGILADLASKSFTSDAPSGWSCAFGSAGDPSTDGPFVFCSSPGGTLAQGASVTITLTFMLPAGYDVSVPLPVIAYSQWSSSGAFSPHRISTGVAAVAAPAPPAPTPAPTPAPGPTPFPGEPVSQQAVHASLRTASIASAGSLPTTGTDPAGLLGLGAALLAAGAALTRRKRF